MHSRIIQHSIDTNYKHILSQQHERQSDYPWFIRHIHGDDILDLGCMAHAFFTKILCEYGFNVTGVDLDNNQFEQEVSLNFKNFRYVKSEVTNIPLPDKSFSTIIAPSLLEHIGIGFYGDTKGANFRKAAIKEWFRLLKDDGIILIQVPYGAKSRTIRFKGRDYYIVYTDKMINDEFYGYSIADKSYNSFEPHGWIEVSKSVADHIDHDKPFTPCIANFAIKKHEHIAIYVSDGEIVDKMTILKIKRKSFKDHEKIRHVEEEIESLKEAYDAVIKNFENRLVKELEEINKRLWSDESEIRGLIGKRDFGKRFVELSKDICSSNDKRCAIKAKINNTTHSALKEEKEYTMLKTNSSRKN